MGARIFPVLIISAALCGAFLHAENGDMQEGGIAAVRSPGRIPYLKTAAADHDYYVLGDPDNAKTAPSPGLLLSGGGKDLDSAMTWLVKKAGGGDFLVIRCSGNDAYADYLYNLAPLDSVETIVFKHRSASQDPFILSKVRSAEGIFIAGGDQAVYLSMWKDTPLEDELSAAIRRGIPVGGTSAGLAVLGQFIYSAEKGSIYSDEMLRDPYSAYASFRKDFLQIPVLANIITDTHFRQRDRMGRLVGFLGRLSQDAWSAAPRGIGIDEQTAVLIESGAKARVVGKGKAYFLEAKGPPIICRPQTPLTYENIYAYSAGEGAVFDLELWQGVKGTPFTVSAREGVLTPQAPYY